MIRTLIVNVQGLSKARFTDRLHVLLAKGKTTGAMSECFRRSTVTTTADRSPMSVMGSALGEPLAGFPATSSKTVAEEYQFGDGFTLRLYLDQDPSKVRQVELSYNNLVAAHRSAKGMMGVDELGLSVVAWYSDLIALLIAEQEEVSAPFTARMDWLVPVIFTSVGEDEEMSLAEQIPLPWLYSFLDRVLGAAAPEILNAKISYIEVPQLAENTEGEGEKAREVIAAHS